MSRIDETRIPESLLRQVLLQIHRFSIDELNTPGVLEREIGRVAERVNAKLEAVPDDLSQPFEVDLQSTHLGLVDSTTAELVHGAYHYLGSPRGNGIHLGLFSNTTLRRPHLMTLVTFSKFDLPHIVSGLPLGIRPEEVVLLSRLFSFSWCPRNAMSHTLGLTFSWVRKHRPEVRMLITYLDPNLGFRGTIYQATNWIFFGKENKRRYLYLDGNYVTDRAMIKQYGTADLQKLEALLGRRITSSKQPLRPLELYAYLLDRRDRAKHTPELPHVFTPPPALVGG
jgi:hypothetical protein